eukprot:UN3931
MDSHLVLCQLHSRLLRALSDHAQVHFPGLRHAARHALRAHSIDGKLRKKLDAVDGAYNLVRHMTSAGNDSFVSTVMQSLPHGHEDGHRPSLKVHPRTAVSAEPGMRKAVEASSCSSRAFESLPYHDLPLLEPERASVWEPLPEPRALLLVMSSCSRPFASACFRRAHGRWCNSSYTPGYAKLTYIFGDASLLAGLGRRSSSEARELLRAGCMSVLGNAAYVRTHWRSIVDAV